MVRFYATVAVVVVSEAECPPFARMRIGTELSGHRAIEQVEVQFGPAIDLKDALRWPTRDGGEIQLGACEAVLHSIDAAPDIRESEGTEQALADAIALE